MAAWFQQLNATAGAGASLSRPESGFVSGDSRSERNPADDPNNMQQLQRHQSGGRGRPAVRASANAAVGRSRSGAATTGGGGGGGGAIDVCDGGSSLVGLKEADDLCDEYLLVEGASNLWAKLSAKKRRKLLSLRLGKVTTF